MPQDLDAKTEALATQVVDACFAVHSALGPGFLESVYQRALAVELASRGVPFVREVPVQVRYKDQVVGDGRLDLVADDRIVIECKTVDALHDIHRAQLISYLKATGMKLGFLVNFNTPRIKDGLARIVRTA